MQLGTEYLLFAARPDEAVAEAMAAPMDDRSAATAADPAIVTVELPLPDELHQRFLQIRDLAGDQVVAVVELLSPANKRPGRGRQEYEEKRLELLGTRTHLVEIDLLREGSPMPMRGHPRSSDYPLIISRALICCPSAYDSRSRVSACRGQPGTTSPRST